jgi:hypothetical protein
MDTRLSTENPGPGSYSFISSANSPKFTTSKSQKKSIEFSLKTPGPGTYYPNQPISNANNLYQSFRFTKSKKTFLIGRNTGPGPGDYEISPIKDMRCYSFRPKLSLREKDPVPGPGKYEPSFELTKETSPKWAMRGKDDLSSSFKIPGPGTYGVSDISLGPKWAFSRSSRRISSKNTSPGPGAYEIKSTIGDAPSYVNL